MADYDFTATATLNNGIVEWELCRTDLATDRCGKNASEYPSVVVPEGKNNAKFEFVIVDKTNLGIKFAPDPIWIQQDTKPTGPILDAQIPLASVEGKGTDTLRFKDKNDNPNGLFLKYQLNFTDAQGKAVTPIDPDIVNGGKGFIGADGATSVLLLVAVAASLFALVASVLSLLTYNKVRRLK